MTTVLPGVDAGATTTGGVVSYLLGDADDHAVALVTGEQTYTYGDLRRAVAAMRRRLRAADLAPGSPVPLIAPNGLLWIAGYLGTIDAGLVTVPLSPTLTAAETAGRISWLGAEVVIAAQSCRAPLRDTSCTVLGEEALTGEACPDEPVEQSPDADAVYVFTSGTTGEPRAVRLTQRNIRANTESILGYLGLRPEDRALVVLPFGYVFGASLLHTHLRVGATLVLPTGTAYPEVVAAALERERCTVFAGVPSVFHALLRNSTYAQRALPDLRIVQQAGGRLPPALLADLVAAHPHAAVFVMYGQTEATARLSALDPAVVLERPGSIGRGIPGVRLRVVDADGADVAPGEVGEIVAKGDNISPGYLGDPEASQRRMPRGTLRTGDLATVDGDGYIYIADRAEDFIKSWGHRVPSCDVEAVAMELHGLIAAAAVGVPDDVAGERIELVAVPCPNAEVTADAVLRHCRARLPRHAVPAAVHFVDHLPVNANGKVLKRELRALFAVGDRDD